MSVLHVSIVELNKRIGTLDKFNCSGTIKNRKIYLHKEERTEEEISQHTLTIIIRYQEIAYYIKRNCFKNPSGCPFNKIQSRVLFKLNLESINSGDVPYTTFPRQSFYSYNVRYVGALPPIIMHAPLQPSLDVAGPTLYPKSGKNADRTMIQLNQINNIYRHHYEVIVIINLYKYSGTFEGSNSKF